MTSHTQPGFRFNAAGRCFLFLLTMFWSMGSLAQPANDDCASATTIATVPFAASCNVPLAATTQGATPSANAPTCAGNSADDDVWFKFTATAASVVIRVSAATQIPSGTASVGVAAYNGSCPASAASIFCRNAFSFGAGHTVISGLAVGSTVYLRFWSASTTNDMAFSFCVQDLPAAPANDECSGALALTVNPFGQDCTTPVQVSTLGATASATPAAGCGGADNNDDTWYKFTASSAQHIIRFSNLVRLLGSPNSLGMTIYDGGAAGAETCPSVPGALLCTTTFGFFDGYQLAGGFIPGHVYYLRLWAAGADNFASFDLCIQAVPGAPANDDCTGAIVLTPQPFGQACTTPMMVNTAGATPSATPANACGGGDNNDDVWFRFDAVSTQHIFRFNNLVQSLGNPNALGISIYDGGVAGAAVCPAAGTSITCDASYGFFNGYLLTGGFITGHTYYVRLWTSGSQNFGSFEFCVQQVPPAPLNDDCSGAIALTVQPFGQTCVSGINISTAGANASSIPATACGSADNNDDVWYKFEALSTQHIFRFSNLVKLLGTPSSIGIAVYNGGVAGAAVCPATPATVVCDANFGFNEGYRLAGGFIPGNTYYVRVWASGAQNFASMEFCVQEVPPAPANDDCSGALPLVVQPFGQACTASAAVVTAGGNASASPTPGCGSADNNDDLWYRFDATSAQHIFRFSNLVQLLGNPNAVGMAVYDGGVAGAAVCPASSTTLICDANFGFFNGYRLAGGFVPGNTYYVRLWASGTQNFAAFDFCVQEVPPPPPNDDCVNATLVSLQPSGSNCQALLNISTAGCTTSANKASCMNAGNTEDDLWYKFTATTANIRIIYSSFQALLGNPNSIGYAFYQAACPVSSASMVCSNVFGFFGGKTLLGGFVPGQTYYLRLWTGGNEDFASFSLCLQEVNPPANDECANATVLQVGAGFCTNAAVTNLFDATTSAGFNAAPNCRGGARTEDVWFSLNIPATGRAIVETSPANTTVNDLVMVAYTGNCGGLTQIACDDDGNPEAGAASAHARLAFTGRTPGEKIYFRVVAANESSMGRFATCASDSSAAVRPAVAAGGNCIAGDTLVIADSLANGYRWLPVFDDAGHIMAEIYPNSSMSDTIYNRLFVHGTTPLRLHAGKYYANRNLSVQNRAKTINGRIKMYIKQDEINALRAVDSTLSGISNLYVRGDTTDCSSSLLNIVYNYVPLTASYGSNFSMEWTPLKLGQFFANSRCNATITWTGAVSTQWHDPSNWDCGGVPWKESSVFIPAAPARQPVVSQASEVKALQVQNGASVTVVPGVSLKVNGQ